jgi:hypothetical protein
MALGFDIAANAERPIPLPWSLPEIEVGFLVGIDPQGEWQRFDGPQQESFMVLYTAHELVTSHAAGRLIVDLAGRWWPYARRRHGAAQERFQL